MEQCYICLDETEEQSPCECKAPLCRKCLLEYVEEYGNKECSICKTEIVIEENSKCECYIFPSAVLMSSRVWLGFSEAIRSFRRLSFLRRREM